MFARLITDSFTRRPRRKMLTVAALALGMAVVTAALSVASTLAIASLPNSPPSAQILSLPRKLTRCRSKSAA